MKIITHLKDKGQWNKIIEFAGEETFVSSDVIYSNGDGCMTTIKSKIVNMDYLPPVTKYGVKYDGILDIWVESTVSVLSTEDGTCSLVDMFTYIGDDEDEVTRVQNGISGNLLERGKIEDWLKLVSITSQQSELERLRSNRIRLNNENNFTGYTKFDNKTYTGYPVFRVNCKIVPEKGVMTEEEKKSNWEAITDRIEKLIYKMK